MNVEPSALVRRSHARARVRVPRPRVELLGGDPGAVQDLYRLNVDLIYAEDNDYIR